MISIIPLGGVGVNPDLNRVGEHKGFDLRGRCADDAFGVAGDD